MPNKVQTPTNPVNEAHKSYKQSRTTFPTSYAHYTSEVYGRLSPFYFMDGVEGDTIPLKSHEEVRTPTMKAPLMSKITKSKDYYAIPMRAILPKTWEQIYTNPTQGDDIPEDANCCVNLYHLLRGLNTMFYLGNASDQTLTVNKFKSLLTHIFFYESLLSDGSLLAKDGIHLGSLFRYSPADADGGSDIATSYTYDQWLDMVFFPWLKTVPFNIVIDGISYAYSKDVVADNYVSMHRLVELMRDYPDFTVQRLFDIIGQPNITLDVADINWEMIFGLPSQYTIETPAITQFINIAHQLAYQIVCYHFYTNDKVDPVFTAQLYRGLMTSLFGDVVSTSGNATAANINSVRKYYEYNGELLEYDIFSGAVINVLLSTYMPASGDISNWSSTGYYAQCDKLMQVLRNIFGFNRSLRYGDYFTGARPNPLAVGDVNTAVVSNEVNTLDLTKNLLMQRFLNSVNRVGRKFSSYVQMLSGRLPASTPTNPIFLAHTATDIGSYEIENTTSENQGSIVTNMRDGSSKYAFSYDVNEPCVIIGLSWYEVSRIYGRTIERRAFHKTRFDMFNKFFQYAGDQAIYKRELDARWLSSTGDPAQMPIFGYTLRYMEYKQRISHCSGAFMKYLPGYAFITDKNISDDNLNEISNISPEQIRAREEEFDQFFSSVANLSLGGCFHFIVKYVNECDAHRQMEYAPSML